MKIESIHVEVAKLLWEGELTGLQIAKQKKITERTISNWKNKPEFDQLLKDLEEESRSSARREALRWARRSVKTLVKLQDIAISRDDSGSIVSEEFKFGADVARKAAVDLLEMAGIMGVEGEGTNLGGSLVIIRSGNGNGSGKSEGTQALSGAVRLQPFRIPGDGGGLGNG